MMQVDPFQNQMLFQSGGEEQSQGHVFSPYNAYPQQNTYPQQNAYSQQSAVPATASTSQGYVSYSQNADPSKGVNMVPAQTYMQGTHQMFYNYPSQNQTQLQQPQQSQQNAGYFQPAQGVMRYPTQTAAIHNGNRWRGNRMGRGGNRFFTNPYGYVAPTSYGSNNAVPEKTPTVRLFNPTTQKAAHIKLNRIFPTMADVRSESNVLTTGKPKLVLCTDFLSAQGCPHASGCYKVHISDAHHMWEPIEATLQDANSPASLYNPGFSIRCYDLSQLHYLSVPSEMVQVTKGSADYIVMYNQHGENFKPKFELCAGFLSGSCENGHLCHRLHCVERDMNHLMTQDAMTTHQNNSVLMASVPRLPATIVVRAFDQNSSDSYHDYSGSQVLLNQGARTYVKLFIDSDSSNFTSRRRMQHCAHFRLKDMCRLGESCRFLHVLTTPEELNERERNNRNFIGTAQPEARAPSMDDKRGTTHNPYA